MDKNLKIFFDAINKDTMKIIDEYDRSKNSDVLMLELSKLMKSFVELCALQAERTIMLQDNLQTQHMYLSSLIVEYCERMAILIDADPLAIHETIKSKIAAFSDHPESHLYVVRD